MSARVLPPSRYYTVFAALVVMTFLTVGMSFLGLGEWHTVAGLTMVLKAASYLIDRGPVTPQEPWEESSGYSPSTLASHIAALICAAAFAADRGDRVTAQYLRVYADFLECHIEPWTVTTEGTLVSGVPRHYIRINPVDVNDSRADEDPKGKVLALKNQPPDARTEYPANVIVDAGFLELVRYGIRKPAAINRLTGSDYPLWSKSVRAIQRTPEPATDKRCG